MGWEREPQKGTHGRDPRILADWKLNSLVEEAVTELLVPAHWEGIKPDALPSQILLHVMTMHPSCA